MKRAIAIVLIIGLAVLSVLLLQDRPQQITVTNAKAFGPPESAMFMVTATIENNGAPDQLLAVTSAAADMVSVMNPNFPGVALTVPGESTGVLAMDGAHLMMRLDGSDFEQGAFVPLTLSFANAGEVSTRIEHAGMSQMSHDPADGVTTDPPPRLELIATSKPSAEGFDTALEVENFAFLRVEDDSPHVAPQGHAHVYLNGLKLGRLYEPSFRVGALMPGDYVLSVALNSNDHRPYLANGAAVSRSISFTVP